MKIMLLSIGMIVKNEENNLDKCLKGIKPLLDELDSELVIVDTGSSDKTVEIAKKYTDKIYHFEWINDFSAARNFGLEKCSGEWYMYLDADEVLDDASELIEFFKSGNYKNYVCAYHAKHEYSDESYQNYSISYCCRIFKNENIHFINKIHEIIPEKEPSITLENTWYHHYGYVKEYLSKIERNEEIIQDILKDDPKNLWALRYHYRNLEAEYKYQDIIAEFENTTIENTNTLYYYQILQVVFSAYLNDKNVDKALEIMAKINDSANDLLYMYSKLISYYLDPIDYLNIRTYLQLYLNTRDKAIEEVKNNHALDAYGDSFRDIAYLEKVYKLLVTTMVLHKNYAIFNSLISLFHEYPAYTSFDLSKEYEYVAYMEDYIYAEHLAEGEGKWWHSYLLNKAINEHALTFPSPIEREDIPYLVTHYNSIDYTSNIYGFIINLEDDIEEANDLLLIMYILEHALTLNTCDDPKQLLVIFNNLCEFTYYFINKYYKRIEDLGRDLYHFLLPYYAKIAADMGRCDESIQILNTAKRYNPNIGYMIDVLIENE